MAFVRSASLSFCAGCVGGLANSLLAWFMGHFGISHALGVKMAPHLTAPWLYQRLIWGGIWGLLFLLPIARLGKIGQGMLFSLAPSLVMLLVIFPYQMGKGWFGFELGILTPALVILCNLVWGIVAGFWLILSRDNY